MDGATYDNAKRDLGAAMSTVSEQKGEILKLKAKVKDLTLELETERKHKPDEAAAAQRNLFKPELRKYAVTTWGPGNQTNWSMQKAESAAGQDPWPNPNPNPNPDRNP